MGRMPVPPRPRSFLPDGCPSGRAWGITRRFHRLSPGKGLVAYALRTRAPLSLPRRGDPVRLACIRPAASVHPEPGSNSSLYYCCTVIDFLFRAPLLLYQVYLACFLCWLQTVKELSRPPLFLTALSSGRKRLQNYSFFRYWQHFFKVFFKKNFLTFST